MNGRRRSVCRTVKKRIIPHVQLLTSIPGGKYTVNRENFLNGGKYMSITPSCVKMLGGVPTLFVNDQPIAQTAYITYLTYNNDYASFAKCGYKLFSMPVYFATRTMSERSQMPPFSAGIFEDAEDYFDHFDEEIKQILDVCPDAMIFPRVNVNPPIRWDEKNPDELEDVPLSEIARKRPCFSSDRWAEEVKRMLTRYIRHIQSASYSANIIGYQIAGGSTDEWFPFDGKGSVGIRSREKYRQYLAESGAEDNEPEYYRFLERMLARRICEFAHHAKQLTEGKQMIGSFYGYTCECPSRNSLHHALKMVLDCEDIDFLCSPVAYDFARAPGRDHPPHVPVESLKLHGKLYFAENDTRTHLSRPFNNTPHFMRPVWFGPDRETSREIMRMHFASTVTHGHASWWFDMWGGWYKDDVYMDTARRALAIAGESLSRNRASVSELAVFIDEDAFSYIGSEGFEPDPSVGVRVCKETRPALGTSGVPYDLYIASDYEQAKDKYKAVVVLQPYPTALSARITEDAAARGIPCLVIDKHNCGITAAELRSFCEQAGLHLYMHEDAAVFANESYVYFHTAKEGAFHLYLPDENAVLHDAFTGEIVSFPLNLRFGQTMLLEILKP